MAFTDYNKQKKLDVDSVSGTPTVDKATPIIVKGESSSGDISTASLTQSINTQDGDPQGLTFSDDGTKMFEIGDFSNNIYEYDLTTAFDISTASFTQSINTQDGIPRGLAFNSDGTKLYEIGFGSNKIYESDLSTAFDISTASFSQSINTQDSTPEGLAFNSDGTKMFEIGSGSNNIYEYDLSTAFDISTASFTQSIDTQDGSPTGIAFSNDGTKMFEIGNADDNIYEYDLTTAFDISTANFTRNISTQDDTPKGIAFNSDGTKLYEIGFGSTKIYQSDVSGQTDAKTGNGNIVIDFTNVSSESDLAVYDQNDSLLGYEIESFDASNETAVLWVYDDWVRDGSTQAKVVYGDGPTGPNASEEGGPSDVWGNTGQNLILAHHFNESSGQLTDSGPNNLNSDSTTGTIFDVDAQFNGGRFTDGNDDQIVVNDNSLLYGMSELTIVSWANADETPTSGFQILLSMAGPGGSNAYFINQTDSYRLQVRTGGGKANIRTNNISTGEDYLLFGAYDGSTFRGALDDNSLNSNSSVSGSVQDASGNDFSYGNNNGLSQHRAGNIDATRLYSESKSNEWRLAEYDASPKAGQVFFSQQAAESTVTVQTVSVPISNGSATSVNPAVSPSGQATVNTVTSTASTQSLNPQVQPQTATVNATTNTASTQSLNPQVTPQTATVQTPVSTGTGNSINPAVTGTGITSVQTSVNQAQAESLNPSVEPQTVTIATPVNTANAESTTPVITTSLIVNVPTSTVNTSNPEPGVNSTGQATVQTQINQTTASNPEPSVSPGIVQVQTSVNQTQADSLNPETSATGTASIQTAVNNLIADSINPAIDPTTITIQTSTNNATTESFTPQVTPGTATVQTSTNQVSGQSINPDVVLFKELDFEAPTKAIINKPNRFVFMQSRTFKTNDLGDELSATLKDENGALDLSEGVSSVTLLMRDLKGNKVLDQQVTITDGANGEIEYEWSSSDTPIQEPGAYQAEFEILDTRDNAETVPNDGFVTIETEDDING